MIDLYQGDLGKLSDEELASLIKELEDSGALSEDQFDYEPSDWIWQAHERASAIWREQRRRRLEHMDPEARAREEKMLQGHREIMQPLFSYNATRMIEVLNKKFQFTDRGNS